MTLYDFKALEMEQQADVTWEHGVLLGFREQGGRHMMLYRLDDFYVEMIYNSSKNEITLIRSFITETFLEPYLERIDITGLLP